MKKVIGLLFVVVFVLAGCGSSGDNQTLTIGMECDYAPYNWTTTETQKSDYAVMISGSINTYCDGYDVKIATEIAKSLDKELVIKKISWDGLIPAVQSGEIDAIIAGMSPTEERRQTIAFTDAYFDEDTVQGIVVKTGSDLASATTLADFSGKKVAAQLGTLQVGLLEQIPNLVDTTALESYVVLVQALESGTIDGFAAEGVVGEKLAQENAGVTFISFEEGQGFVVAEDQTTTAIGLTKQNTELLEVINEALATITLEQRLEWMQQATNNSEQ